MIGPSKALILTVLVILFLDCNALCVGSQAVQAAPPQPTAVELAIYAKARSLVDMSADELLRAYPEELRDLKLDDNPGELGVLLQKVGENVETFFRDFPNTTSKEEVRRERLSIDGTAEDFVTQDFNYTVQTDKAGSFWKEGRTDSKGRPVDSDPMRGASFLTSGFANVGIFLHPRHQIASRFRYLGRQASESNAYVIAFAQKPEFGDFIGAFQTQDMKEAALMMHQGLVWVDPRTCQIVRMRTDLLARRPDILLARLTTEIWFAEVRFASVSQSFWMPREVRVTIGWNGRTYRNRHRYSEYMVFSVESRDKVEQPKIKK